MASEASQSTRPDHAYPGLVSHLPAQAESPANVGHIPSTLFPSLSYAASPVVANSLSAEFLAAAASQALADMANQAPALSTATLAALMADSAYQQPMQPRMHPPMQPPMQPPHAYQQHPTITVRPSPCFGPARQNPSFYCGGTSGSFAQSSSAAGGKRSGAKRSGKKLSIQDAAAAIRRGEQPTFDWWLVGARTDVSTTAGVREATAQIRRGEQPTLDWGVGGLASRGLVPPPQPPAQPQQLPQTQAVSVPEALFPAASDVETAVSPTGVAN